VIPALDEYAARPSALAHWEPRCKVVGLGALILAFSCLREPWLLLMALLVAGLVFRVSRLPGRFLLTRLRVPAVFLIAIGLLLPWIDGTTILLRVGPLALRAEGLRTLAEIVVKFLAIFTVGVALFGTAPLPKSIRALRGLGLPRLLADLMLFAYRFVHEIGADLDRMRTAARLRGFDARRQGLRLLRTTTSLAATLLVRSHERAETVHCAMLLRGYGGAGDWGLQRVPRAADVLAALAAACAAVGMVAADLWLRGGPAWWW
jgi:cobalt/nickel transport system permease protein